MPAYTKNDIRKAIELEQAISDALGATSQDAHAIDAGEARQAYAVSQARMKVLRSLYNQMPCNEDLGGDPY